MDTQKIDPDAHASKTLLFVTNAESGQANTILALALEALTRPHVEVHIASFPVLKQRVEKLSPKLNFHALDGKGMLETMASNAQGWTEANLSHPPTRKSFAAYGPFLGLVLAVWDGEGTFRSLSGCGWYLMSPPFDPAYMRIYDSIVKVIQKLNPGLVVVDNLFNAGVDACHSLNRKFVLNTPNCVLDVVRDQQPWLKGFWCYPMFVFASNPIPKLQLSFTSLIRPGTGLSFPIPWRDIPTNIMASIMFIYRVTMSPDVSELVKHRNAHGLSGWLPTNAPYTRKLHIICPCVRELDFPLVVPDNVGLYGSIVLDTSPIEVADPEMNRWLDGGETVVMCMGTHFRYTESQVKAVINGFLGAVGHDSNTQFLWKLFNKAKFEHLIEGILKHQKNRERFMIVDWLKADPISIMRHPNAIVYIHHGGANSYFEAAL